jgi:hypothetical protein
MGIGAWPGDTQTIVGSGGAGTAAIARYEQSPVRLPLTCSVMSCGWPFGSVSFI